jgi:hypothetical protein
MGSVPQIFETTQIPTGLAWWLAVGWWEVEVELNVMVHFPLWRPFWKLYQLYQYGKFRQDWPGGLERE